MIRRRFAAFAVAGLVLSLSLCLSGCSVGLKDAYSLKERIPSIETSFAAEEEAAKGFASDLCVISDEGSFNPEDVTSQAGALFDLTDREVLYSKDAFEKLYPASITKVVTALIAIKYGNLEDQVTVTEDAAITETGATLCGIQPGDTLTLEQLLYGLMLPSGNDAGAAIAIHMAGSIDAFADKMNELYRAAKPETNLKSLRTLAEMSQSELAGQAEIPVRTIQQYEQRQKDINKAQGETLLRLARVLHCSIDDLMEKVPQQ